MLEESDLTIPECFGRDPHCECQIHCEWKSECWNQVAACCLTREGVFVVLSNDSMSSS
jgi:hypothetical protein